MQDIKTTCSTLKTVTTGKNYKKKKKGRLLLDDDYLNINIGVRNFVRKMCRLELNRNLSCDVFPFEAVNVWNRIYYHLLLP